MATPLAFGTYIPGESPVHNLNAQVKILLACAFSVAAFFVESWAGMAVLWVAVLALFAAARLRVSHALAGLKPVAFILLFTVAVHAFSFGLDGAGAGADAGSTGAGAGASGGAPGVWVLAGGFGITLDGTLAGLFLALRIALLVAVCSLLTFTSSTLALTDGLTSLLGPLRRVHVPVDDIATVVSMALRFIPTTAEEANRVVQAQKARGADFESGSVFARVRAWVPVLVPLFVRLFRRADEVAVAMDARCYRGEGRTHARQAGVGAGDVAAGAVMAAGLLAVCVLL